MDFLKCCLGRDSFLVLFISLGLFFLFKGFSACVSFRSFENLNTTYEYMESQSYVRIIPDDSFEYLSFQPVVNNLPNNKTKVAVITITKSQLLEANKLSNFFKEYEIQIFIHEHSRIFHKNEYIMAVYTGQSQFVKSFKLSWLEGAAQRLRLIVRGGSITHLNCRSPEKAMISDFNRLLSSRNYTNNKTRISTFKEFEMFSRCWVWNSYEFSFSETEYRESQGYIRLNLSNKFEYISFQAVVNNSPNKKTHNFERTITKTKLLKAYEFSKFVDEYEIQFFIYKHSRIFHKNEYVMAVYIGTYEFIESFKLSWLEGAVKWLNLKVRGGAKVLINCGSPENDETIHFNNLLSERNYTNSKTSIKIQSKKKKSDDPNIREALSPRSLLPTQTNETKLQNQQTILTSSENSSTNIQYIFFGSGISCLVLSMIVLVIVIFSKRSRKTTSGNNVCLDELKKINVASKSANNECQNQQISSVLEKHTSKSNSSYFRSSIGKTETEYELPPLQLWVNSQIECETEYCNSVVKNSDYLDMSKTTFH
ncbi:UNVERIFIED_CONTAM: hypothetical protein RMT77_004823 [Armadillidium vulgare]